MLFFEVTILTKFGKVYRLSLKLYLKVEIAKFKNTRRSFPIKAKQHFKLNSRHNAVSSNAGFGSSGEIADNYLPRAVFCITSSCED